MRRRTGAEYGLVILLAIVASALTHLITIHFQGDKISPAQMNSDVESSVYDRVLKTSTIRCGYVIYPPGSVKDPNSGKMSGIFVETLERAAENMGLKVEWAEEVGWGSMIEGLLANRYDLIGTPVWANSSRGKLADFTVPLFYSGIGVYVREEDHRFDENLALINSPQIKISTIDGEMSDIISRQQFPQASRFSLPQLSDNSQLLLNVVDSKADVTFVEPYIAQLFLKNNLDKLRNIASERPIRVFPNTMMLRKGDIKFKSMLDTAIMELVNSGFVESLLQKYAPDPRAFYSVAYPYRTDGASAK